MAAINRSIKTKNQFGNSIQRALTEEAIEEYKEKRTTLQETFDFHIVGE